MKTSDSLLQEFDQFMIDRYRKWYREYITDNEDGSYETEPEDQSFLEDENYEDDEEDC